MHFSSRVSAAICGLLGLTHAVAEEPRDYSDGLQRLAALGLPDLQGAEWVKGPDRDGGHGMGGDYRFMQMDVRLRGGGWKTASGGFLPMGATETVSLPEGGPAAGATGAVGSLLGRMIDNYRENNPEPEKETPPGKPKDEPSMLERDVETLIKKLGDEENRRRVVQMIEHRDADLIGPLMVFAAQMQAAGHPAPASRLASLLLGLSPDRTVIIDAAITHIAEARYAKLASTFFESYDWKAYQTGLEELMETFPRGWDGRLAVAMLLEPVRQRAEGKAVLPPSLEGLPLPPAALKLVARWSEPPDGEVDLGSMNLPEGMDLSDIPPEYRAQVLAQFSGFGGWQNDSGLWLLGEPGEEERPARSNPVSAVKDLGMDGLITLAALAGDKTLTTIPNDASSGSYYSSSESTAEKVRRIYSRMNRPLTRGEIAAKLLQPVVPYDDSASYYGSGPDPAMLAEKAISFWKEHRDSDLVTLCRTYLEEGSESQRTSAANRLATLPDERAATAFEETVLNSDSMLGMLQPVSVYLSSRKAAAAPFFKTFSEQLRKNYGGVSDEQLQRLPGGWEIVSEGGIEGQIKKLGVLVGASSVEELIADAIAGNDEDDPQRWRRLISSLESITPGDLYVPFAEAIIEAEGEVRTHLLSTFTNVTARTEEEVTLSPEAIEAWAPLLADTGKLPEADSARWFSNYGCTTVREAAALAIEFAVEPGAWMKLATQMMVADEPVSEFVLRRTRARFDGGDVPGYVTSENVSDERRTELAQLASSGTVMELREKIFALRPGERAAWHEWLQQLDGSPEEMPPVIRKAASTIVTVATEPALDKPDLLPEVAAALEIEPGTEIDGALLESLATDLLKRADSHPTLHLAATPAKFGIGLEVAVTGSLDVRWLQYMATMSPISEAEADAYALAYFSSPDTGVIWQSKDGEIKPLTEKQDGRFPAFVQYEEMLGSPRFRNTSPNIMIFTREALAESADEDSALRHRIIR